MLLIHSASPSWILSVRMIAGTATLTIVASTMISETPRLRTAIPSQRRRAGAGVAAGDVSMVFMLSYPYNDCDRAARASPPRPKRPDSVRESRQLWHGGVAQATVGDPHDAIDQIEHPLVVGHQQARLVAPLHLTGDQLDHL